MRLVRLLQLAVPLAALAVVPACAETKPPPAPGTLEYTENARAAYQKALDAYLDHDWEGATELFTALKQDYAQSQYARLAELRLADIAFEQDKLPEAISAYKGFIQAHRHDPGLAYASYRVCKALFLQVGDSILLPPQEERDQGAAIDAWKELRKFKRDFSETKWDREVDYMLVSVTGRLARHELYVARFYLVRDNFEATVARIQYMLGTYESSGLEPEGMVLLGETYLKMKKRDEARETFQRIVAMYPDSPFTVPARSFLLQMNAPAR